MDMGFIGWEKRPKVPKGYFANSHSPMRIGGPKLFKVNNSYFVGNYPGDWREVDPETVGFAGDPLGTRILVSKEKADEEIRRRISKLEELSTWCDGECISCKLGIGKTFGDPKCAYDVVKDAEKERKEMKLFVGESVLENGITVIGPCVFQEGLDCFIGSNAGNREKVWPNSVKEFEAGDNAGIQSHWKE